MFTVSSHLYSPLFSYMFIFLNYILATSPTYKIISVLQQAHFFEICFILIFFIMYNVTSGLDSIFSFWFGLWKFSWIYILNNFYMLTINLSKEVSSEYLIGSLQAKIAVVITYYFLQG